MRRKLFGEKSEPVSESHGHLGDLLVDMGNHRDAKLQYKLAVDIREGAGDKMSPITAKYLANMGNCHRVLQNYEAAFSLLERARLSLELFLGPEDLATLAVFFNLAMVGQKQKTGKYEQALEYHIKVLGPREDKFGKDHPIISDSYMNIGLCKIGQGRLNECMDCFNLALKIRHSKLGNDDPETAECKAKVGLGFAAQKQYENSLVYCYQAEITLEKTVGPNHVYSYGLYINMADCFRAQSEYTDALKYYNKAQDMALVVFGGRSVQVSTGRILMGQTKLEARDISGALELFRQAHKTDLVVRPTEINTINTGILIQQIERSVNNARAEQQGRGIPNGVGSTALSQ
jgi:tetratricopeptide (TPR) repeat protein